MNKIIRTIAFTLVLAGLLAWGASTMAQVPSATQGLSIGQGNVEIVTSTELNTVDHSDLSRVHYVGQ